MPHSDEPADRAITDTCVKHRRLLSLILHPAAIPHPGMQNAAALGRGKSKGMKRVRLTRRPWVLKLELAWG